MNAVLPNSIRGSSPKYSYDAVKVLQRVWAADLAKSGRDSASTSTEGRSKRWVRWINSRFDASTTRPTNTTELRTGNPKR